MRNVIIRRMVFVFVIFLMSSFIALVTFRTYFSDGLLLASYMAIVAIAGSIAAHYFVKVVDSGFHLRDVLSMTIAVFTLLFFAYLLNGSTTDRAQLVTNQRQLIGLSKELLTQRIEQLKSTYNKRLTDERRQEIINVMRALESAEVLNGDRPYFVGMLFYYIGEPTKGIQSLSQFLDSGPSADTRTAEVYFTRSRMLYELATGLVGAKKCDALSDALTDDMSALEIDFNPDYQLFRNRVASDLLSASCEHPHISATQLREWSATALPPSFIPEPGKYLSLSFSQWQPIATAPAVVERYTLRLSDIRAQLDYSSIRIDVRSKNRIVFGKPEVPSGIIVPSDQEPTLLENTDDHYSFFFPHFDPSLGWYIVIDVEPIGSRAEQRNFITRVDYVKFP